MAVRINGTATVPASLQTDITTIRTNVATILADVTTLLARLTAARAGYLDQIPTSTADITTLIGRLTALRAGYLDNLADGPVALQSSTSQIANDSQGTTGTIYQLIAATAAATRKIIISGNVQTGPNTGTTIVDILTGPGGSETLRASATTYTSATILDAQFYIEVDVDLPAGTRIAWRATVSSGQSNQTISLTAVEA